MKESKESGNFREIKNNVKCVTENNTRKVIGNGSRMEYKEKEWKNVKNVIIGKDITSIGKNTITESNEINDIIYHGNTETKDDIISTENKVNIIETFGNRKVYKGITGKCGEKCEFSTYNSTKMIIIGYKEDYEIAEE